MNDVGAKVLFGCLAAILGWLVYNGLTTGSVWAKGARNAFSADPRDWATPYDREESPVAYWLTIAFYSAGIVFVLWAIVFDPFKGQ